MKDFDLIIGIHSIGCTLANDTRSHKRLVYTETGLEELLKRTNIKKSDLDGIEQEMLSSHNLQELGKRYFKELDLEFSRIPSQIFLITSELETFENSWLYEQIEKKDDLKILCLDQITDIHNGAAILRTASFYGVDIVILPSKKSFGFTPSFYRIASGATEYINIVQVSSLTKVVSKLISRGVTCIGLTEHAPNPLTDEVLKHAGLGVCLVLGKEETGISNAVLRLLKHQLSLTPRGETQSLNVSVAAAIAMEKSFGKL